MGLISASTRSFESANDSDRFQFIILGGKRLGTIFSSFFSPANDERFRGNRGSVLESAFQCTKRRFTSHVRVVGKTTMTLPSITEQIWVSSRVRSNLIDFLRSGNPRPSVPLQMDRSTGEKDG